MSNQNPLKVKISQDGGTSWTDYVAATTSTPPPPPPPPTTTTPPPAAPPSSGSTTTDKNGINYLQPLVSDGYKLSYSNEGFDFRKNFRSDGSMRCDFGGNPRDSVMIAGYFMAEGTDNNEEVSAKMNGGPHNDTNPEYADVMDLGIVNFAGTASRLRWEKTHPDYSSGIAPTYKELPVGDIRKVWRGYAGLKVNLDTNADGKPDKVAIVGMVDVGGVDANNKPVNQWKITYKRIFLPSEIGLKSVFEAYVKTIGKPELCQQTIRIDQQSQTKWTSSNPPYKYVTCKEVKAQKV